jgi:DNA adenine methylase Dam
VPVSGIIHWLYTTPVETALAEVDRYISFYTLNKENREGYLACRADYNAEDAKTPAHLYALITHAFNNQIRFNSKGEYNMPFGSGRSSFNPALRQRFVDFANKLSHLSLAGSATTFAEVVAPPHSFFYCDPPYLITTATYNEKDGWTPENEEQLLHYLRTLDGYGIKWALSNVTHHQGRTNDLLIAFAEDYNVHSLTMKYSNASYHKKDRESESREVLVTNY